MNYLNQPKPTTLYGHSKFYIGFHIRNLPKKWVLVGMGTVLYLFSSFLGLPEPIFLGSEPSDVYFLAGLYGNYPI